MFKRVLDIILTIVNPILPLIVMVVFFTMNGQSGIILGTILFMVCILSNIIWAALNMDEESKASVL